MQFFLDIFIGYRELSNMQLTCLKECPIPTPNLRMHLFVRNMAEPDISDYEFDADDLLLMPS
jgi:hypothetical protein